MSLSERMIEYRAKHNLSQMALSKKCGLCIQTICNVENEKQKATKITEYKIMKIIKGE